MTTYEDVHAGAVVLGHDGHAWGVADIARQPLSVTLVRHGQRLTGWPPAGTPVTIIDPGPSVAPEYAAVQALLNAGLAPELVSEHYQEG